MRNHLKIVSIGMIALFMLASCSTDVNDVISIGFNRAGSESVSGWVKMGIKTKKEQGLDAEFEISVGAKKGFESWWDENISESHPDYRPYVSCCLISHNNEENALCKINVSLDGFPNDENWSFGTRALEGDDHYEIFFDRSLLVPFSFSEAVEKGFEKGTIKFETTVIDGSSGEEIDEKEEAEMFKRVGGFGIAISFSYEISDAGLVSFAVAV